MYSTEIDGQVLQFGTSGWLYQSNKLMYDKGTNTLWRQFRGEPAVGELVGSGIALEVLPVALTTWSSWVEAHPGTSVLDVRTAAGDALAMTSGRIVRQVKATREADQRVRLRDLARQAAQGEVLEAETYCVAACCSRTGATVLRAGAAQLLVVGLSTKAVAAWCLANATVRRASVAFLERASGGNIAFTDAVAARSRAYATIRLTVGTGLARATDADALDRSTVIRTGAKSLESVADIVWADGLKLADVLLHVHEI